MQLPLAEKLKFFAKLMKTGQDVLFRLVISAEVKLISELHLSVKNFVCNGDVTKQMKGSVKEPNISIYFFFPPITQWRYYRCSV